MNGTPAVIEWTRRKRGRPSVLSPERRAELRADYLAGMPFPDIRAKYGFTGNGTITRVVKDLPRRVNVPEKAVAEPRPTQLPGESKQKYGARVQAWLWANDPAYRERMMKVRKAVARRVRRRNAARKAEQAAASTVDVAPVQIPETVPTPPPSFWQRYFGWLWS